MELRCASGIKHGDLTVEDGVLEVKCRSKRCGHQPGTIVIHRFSVLTGALISTRKFNDPVRRDDAVSNARPSRSVPVAR